MDVVLGEPPAWLHPVVWMGRMQTALRQHAPKNPLRALVWGAFMAMIGPCVSGGLAWLILAHTHGLARLILAVFLLKSAFAVRALATAGWSVSRPLAAGNLGAARAALRGLVSRDTMHLTAPLVAAAAVESVAENASDSIVAPLIFYAIGGVPGALAYRAINTLDAMIGYRGELEWLGKAAARLDDSRTCCPRALTALLLALAAPLGRGSCRPRHRDLGARSTAHREPERRPPDGGDGGRARRRAREDRALPARRGPARARGGGRRPCGSRHAGGGGDRGGARVHRRPLCDLSRVQSWSALAAASMVAAKMRGCSTFPPACRRCRLPRRSSRRFAPRIFRDTRTRQRCPCAKPSAPGMTCPRARSSSAPARSSSSGRSRARSVVRTAAGWSCGLLSASTSRR